MASKGTKLNIRLSDPIELNGDYQGFSFVARLNIPMESLIEMQSGNLERITHAMSDIIYSWEFFDEDGDPMPSIEEARKTRKTQQKAGTWDYDQDPVYLLIKKLPVDLSGAMNKAIDGEMGKLSPNS